MVQIETLPTESALSQSHGYRPLRRPGHLGGGGSREEAPSESGAAHFIEHMLFKGTQRRSAQDIARETDASAAR